MTDRPRVYVASPLGFATTSDWYRTAISDEVRGAGLELLDPWHDPRRKFEKELKAAEALPLVADRRHELERLDKKAGRKNHRLLGRADAVLAVLDGPDVDSGTAAEIGFATAQQIPVVGFRSDRRQTGENDGCPVNLQVTYFIKLHGGDIFDELSDDAVSLLRRLAMRRFRQRNRSTP